MTAIALIGSTGNIGSHVLDEALSRKHSVTAITRDGSKLKPRPGMTVVRFSNSHLVYALTWFGLALMVAGAAVLVARYERRQRTAAHDPAHDPHT